MRLKRILDGTTCHRALWPATCFPSNFAPNLLHYTCILLYMRNKQRMPSNCRSIKKSNRKHNVESSNQNPELTWDALNSFYTHFYTYTTKGCRTANAVAEPSVFVRFEKVMYFALLLRTSHRRHNDVRVCNTPTHLLQRHADVLT